MKPNIAEKVPWENLILKQAEFKRRGRGSGNSDKDVIYLLHLLKSCYVFVSFAIRWTADDICIVSLHGLWEVGIF